jgi:exopolysaccharide biosynthesis protein
MKNLKLVFKTVLVAVFMLLSLNSFSQDKSRANGEAKEKMKERKAELKSKLNLDAKQAEQFDEITLRNRNEAKQKMQSLPTDASQKEKRDIMKTYLDKADVEIIAILNPEQQKIYKEEKEKLKQEKKEMVKRKRAEKEL